MLFVTEPIKRILNSHNVQVAQKPFRTLGHIFAKPKDPVRKEQRSLTNLTVGWDNSKIITTDRRYHQRLCLEAWHINSAHAPLNRDDGGLLPDAYLHLVRKKGR